MKKLIIILLLASSCASVKPQTDLEKRRERERVARQERTAMVISMLVAGYLISLDQY